jgi:glycosyltransferase EpsF
LGEKTPLRIAHFPGSLSYGGVGSVLMGIYRAFDKRRIQFDFYVTRTETGPFDEEITASGGRVIPIPRFQDTGLFGYLNIVKGLLRENGPYQAVHIHAAHNGVQVLLAAKAVGMGKVLYHIHSTNDTATDRLGYLSGVYKIAAKFAIRGMADVYCACGEAAGRYVYGDRLFNSGKVILINNAVDLNLFRPYSQKEKEKAKRKLGIPERTFVFGNAARFVNEKNQAFLIKMVAEMNKVSPTVLILAGDGVTRTECEGLAANLGVRGRVIFTGNRTDMADIYNVMDVFVLPSFFEGLPVTIVEAQACGVPCVMSNVVTVQADMGLGLVESLSLAEGESWWSKVILATASKPHPSREKIAGAFWKKGYSLTSMAKRLQKIYLNNMMEIKQKRF